MSINLLMFIAIFFLFFNTGPSNTALANVTHPSVRATAFALNILIIHALGDAVAPPLIGAVADHTNMNIAFLVVSATMMIAVDRFTLRYPLPKRRMGTKMPTCQSGRNAAPGFRCFDHHDQWQRCAIAVAVVAGSESRVREVLASIERFVLAAADVDLLDVETAWLESERA